MSLQNSHDISEVKVMLLKGADGDKIVDISKTGTSGLVDTYTITLNNGYKYTFTVTNGKSIVSIEKTATVGLVDTYTITYNDGDTDTFDVTNGKDMEPDVSAIVNVYGSKNLLPYPYNETTKTENSLTFTDNGDGTVTVSGTASADTKFYMGTSSKDIVGKGNYILNGIPSGSGNNTYHIICPVYVNDSWTRTIYGVSDNTPIVLAEGESLRNVYIQVKSGTVISSPITFKPMIRDERISDDTYVPYAMTNKELTDQAFIISKVSITSAISLSSGQFDYKLVVTKVGYKAVGVVGHDFSRISGLSFTSVTIYSDTQVYIGGINSSGSSQNIFGHVLVLYQKA